MLLSNLQYHKSHLPLQNHHFDRLSRKVSKSNLNQQNHEQKFTWERCISNYWKQHGFLFALAHPTTYSLDTKTTISSIIVAYFMIEIFITNSITNVIKINIHIIVIQLTISGLFSFIIPWRWGSVSCFIMTHTVPATWRYDDWCRNATISTIKLTIRCIKDVITNAIACILFFTICTKNN